MYTEKEMIHEATSRLKETKKNLEIVKKSMIRDDLKTYLQWLIVQSGYVEECVRIISKKHLEGIETFVKKNIEAIRRFSVKSEEFVRKSPWLNKRGDDSWNRVMYLKTLMISLALSLTKSYLLHEFKGMNTKIETLDKNEDSLILLNDLHEILRASPAQEHHSLLERLLDGYSTLPYVPIGSELKVLVDMGFTSIEYLEGVVDSLDHYKARLCSSHYEFSYEGLARDFYEFKDHLIIISKQHIIGIIFQPKLELRIPKSINLLTKLKIIIIDNQPQAGEYSNFLISPLDTIPNEIAELTKLRILYVINSGLNEFPEEFTQLSKLRYLYVINSNLQVVPNLTKTFPKLRRLRLEGVPLKKTPDWLFEFARKHNSRRYIQKGVKKEDAAVLGLLEIISRPLEEEEYDDNWCSWCFCGYHTNQLGSVTKLFLGFSTQHSQHYVLLYFPEEICKLQQLEILYICNGIYSEERGYYPPCDKEKADAWIPESIRELKSLRYLWTNAKYSESLKPFFSSLKKFNTNIFLNDGCSLSFSDGISDLNRAIIEGWGRRK
jgi:hypothetical protein